MCSAAIPESHQERKQQQLHHHQHDDTIVWSEACATMSARAALTAEMQVNPAPSTSAPLNTNTPHYQH
jgi:hypothetical protein